jgi:NADH:ubiquinone reductase (H+-translocating)
MSKKKVIVIGGGFGGLNAAKGLGNHKDVEILLLDRKNHHLFQPLLYQVATAALNASSIAQPIRGVLSKFDNVEVLNSNVQSIDPVAQTVTHDNGTDHYDYLIMAAGAMHHYFGNNQWEEFAPGLKTLEQAIELRRRILNAYEAAEMSKDPAEQQRLLTFAVVGAGPTGVEMAGAIAEMARTTLKSDFSNVNPAITKVHLIEGGPRILPAYPESLGARAHRDLEELGVKIHLNTSVVDIDAKGVKIKVGDAEQFIEAPTTVWGAGVVASELGSMVCTKPERMNRVKVGPDCATETYKNIFVIGDQAHFETQPGVTLPPVATVAIQMGSFVPKVIKADLNGSARPSFKYWDKGQMAIIGRNRAIAASMGIKMTGFLAWVAWLAVHVYFLVSIKNMFFVIMEWAFSWLTAHRGMRLITVKEWRHYNKNA